MLLLVITYYNSINVALKCYTSSPIGVRLTLYIQEYLQIKLWLLAGVQYTHMHGYVA